MKAIQGSHRCQQRLDRRRTGGCCSNVRGNRKQHLLLLEAFEIASQLRDPKVHQVLLCPVERRPFTGYRHTHRLTSITGIAFRMHACYDTKTKGAGGLWVPGPRRASTSGGVTPAPAWAGAPLGAQSAAGTPQWTRGTCRPAPACPRAPAGLAPERKARQMTSVRTSSLALGHSNISRRRTRRAQDICITLAGSVGTHTDFTNCAILDQMAQSSSQ